jgi:hypothetical protein
MITQAQYDALGPQGREIIDHDRRSAEIADIIAEQPVVGIGVGEVIRGRHATRTRLSAAAATICKRGTPVDGGSGPRTASMGRR